MPDYLIAELPSSGDGASSRETVAQCVARLGTPPDDILNDWIDEAKQLTGQSDLTPFDPDAKFWNSILVESNGRLSTEAPGEVRLSVQKITNDPPTDPPKAANASIWSRWLLISLVIVALGGLGWLLVWRPESVKTKSVMIASASSESEIPQRDDSNSGIPELPSTQPAGVPADARVPAVSDDFGGMDGSANNQADGELLAFDELDTIPPDQPIAFGNGLSLDAFIPPIQPETEPGSSGEPNIAPELGIETAPSTEMAKDFEGALGEQLPTDLLDDDPSGESDISADADERTTIRRDPIAPRVTGVELPTPPHQSDSDMPQAIPLLATEQPIDSLDLQAPEESTLDFELRRDPEGSSWQILANDSPQPIARIFNNEEFNELQFQWLEGVRGVPAANSLTRTRLQTGDGDVVYLRPRLDTDPIPLSLTQRDIKLKWNLKSPSSPRSTEFRLTETIPKDVEWRWIEPIDSTSPRSTRGIALVTLKSSEETAIVIRIDVNTTNSLSLRLRFGARLDPAMPWQWTDAKSIRNAFESVTQQLEVADSQLLNLDGAISRAKRVRARRQEFLLEEQRDRIDEAVKNWTTVANRLAELDQLVAFLDVGANLSPSLVTKWSDGEQVILGVRQNQGAESKIGDGPADAEPTEAQPAGAERAAID